MLRGVTETGSIFIGLVPGALLDRLAAGERVMIPRHIDANGIDHIGLWLDFSGGPRSFTRLIAGERVCIPAVHGDDGRLIHPHVCLFMRADNASLLAAADELFPGGPLPGARFEHVTTEEPT